MSFCSGCRLCVSCQSGLKKIRMSGSECYGRCLRMKIVNVLEIQLFFDISGQTGYLLHKYLTLSFQRRLPYLLTISTINSVHVQTCTLYTSSGTIQACGNFTFNLTFGETEFEFEFFYLKVLQNKLRLFASVVSIIKQIASAVV